MVGACIAKRHVLNEGTPLSGVDAVVYRRPLYYDPTPGRFNTLDPFEGDPSNPQSLQKYLYCHADPVNGIDPSGQILGAFGAFFGGYLGFRYKADLTNIGVGHRIAYRLMGAVGGYAVTTGLALLAVNFGKSAFVDAIQPIWVLPGKTRPDYTQDWTTNGDAADFEENVYRVLMRTVNGRDESPPQRAAGEAGARAVARAYVAGVEREARDGHGSWGQTLNFNLNPFDSDPAPDCSTYVDRLRGELAAAAGSSGWQVQPRYDSRKFGLGWLDFLVWPYPPRGAASRHSYFTVSYKPTSADQADWILDPWQLNRPDVYDSNDQFQTWPLP